MASTDSPRGRSEQREDPSSRFRKARSISRRVTVSLLAVAGSGSFSSMPGTRSTGVVLVEANIVAGKEHEPDHEIYNDAPPRDRADVRDDAPVLGAGIEGEDSQDFQMTELLMDDAEFSDVDEDGTAAQLMQEGEAQTRTTTKVPTPYRCAVNTIGLSSTCMYKRLWFGAKWEAAADDCCKYNSAKSKCSWTGSKGCPREPGMEGSIFDFTDEQHEVMKWKISTGSSRKLTTTSRTRWLIFPVCVMRHTKYDSTKEGGRCPRGATSCRSGVAESNWGVREDLEGATSESTQGGCSCRGCVGSCKSGVTWSNWGVRGDLEGTTSESTQAVCSFRECRGCECRGCVGSCRSGVT
ncbi:unnamed protein product [Amoebophrya sp. A120]|nr:unnamed protein product [Amoebophrya sp. A120]|eukprot:GSA120T00012457001.1